MKEHFLELLKPCCHFSFENLREFIENIALIDENVRKEILSGIKINGNLTSTAWGLFVQNVSFNSLKLNNKTLKIWLGQCYQLNCEQWIQLVKFIEYDVNFRFEVHADNIANFQLERRLGEITNIEIATAEDLKSWIESGYGLEVKNINFNVKVNEFKRSFNPITNRYKIEANVYGDGEKINFAEIFMSIDKIGNLKGLRFLTIKACPIKEFIIKNNIESIEGIGLDELYDLQRFDTNFDLPKLIDFAIINTGLIEFNPKKSFEGLEGLHIIQSNLVRFSPTKPLSSLKDLKLQKHRIEDFSFTNWISFIPKNGVYCIDDGKVSFVGSLAETKLFKKNWKEQCRIKGEAEILACWSIQ